MEEKRIYTYTFGGDFAGYVKIVNGTNGEIIGEIYNTLPDGRVGAVRLEPETLSTQEVVIYGEDGAQVGISRVENYADGTRGSDVYPLLEDGSEAEKIIHVHYNPKSGQEAEVHREAEWGEELGRLEPYNASDEELLLFGPAAAYLLLS